MFLKKNKNKNSKYGRIIERVLWGMKNIETEKASLGRMGSSINRKSRDLQK